jgi:hypothetical protein
VTANTVAMRPERIGRCRHWHHPFLLLREVGGASGITLRIDEAEARLLAGEQDGRRGRHSRTYETLDRIIIGLGARVVGLELVGDREHSLSGMKKVAQQQQQLRIRAHPGDVAALAWRVTSLSTSPLGWCPPTVSRTGTGGRTCPNEAVADLDAMATFRPFLDESDPEDFDW